MVSSRRQLWVAVAALLLFWFLALNSLTGDSPTMDEQNHLARGLAYWRSGDPRLSVEHPPLVNLISTLPLLTMPEIVLPFDDPSWERQPPDVFWYVFAEKLLWVANRDLDIQKMLFLARLPIVYLTMSLALLGGHVARRLWGRRAALPVFLLLLFDPNILAHGRYTSTDLGGTLFVFLATFLLWRLWTGEGGARAWFWAAVGLGLAFSSKLSALAFALIWAVQAVLPLYGPARRGAGTAVRRLVQLLAAAAAALLLVWAVFGFEWGPYHFLDPRLAALNAAAGPLPTFLAGSERILLLSEGGRPAFLLGQFSSDGFLFYFPIAMLVKTPLLTLVVFALAAVLLLRLRATRGRALFLLLPAGGYMALSMVSALNIGYRHLLPILPFIYVLIGGLLADPVREWLARRWPGMGARPWPAALLFVLILALLSIDARLHPHYLSTFNSLAGGPANGHRVLVDSNIDWGQDLLRLQAWLAAQGGGERARLGWFGTADPDYYGLAYDPLPGGPRPPFWSQWTSPPFDVSAPEPGLYAISASSLWEYPLAEKNVYTWFRAREPDARVGYSILIYRVP